MSVFGLGFGIISSGLMLLTAILITATLRIPSLAQRLLSVYLFAYAHLVLVTQITGLTYQLTQRLAWIALHLLFVGLSAWWWRQGTPSLDLLQLPPRGDRHAAVARSLRRYPLLWTFSVAVAVAYLILFFLAVYVPPNNFDGFTYRLTRVAYWLQYDSLYPWHTADVRQVSFPFNAEVGVLWTFLVSGYDTLAGLVQFSAALAATLGIYRLCRLLSLTRPQGIFAALAWSTFPLVVLEATSVQNDLVISLFILAAVVFLFDGLQRESHAMLGVSGMAIGLAIGTKSTFLFVFPGLVTAAALLWAVAIQERFRLFVTWTLSCLAGFVVFGMFIYAQNALVYGQLVRGSLDITDPYTQTVSANMPRYVYNFVDDTGLPEPMRKGLVRAKNAVWERTVDRVAFMTADSKRVQFDNERQYDHLPQEDYAWFGPVAPLLLFVGIALSLFQPREYRTMWLGLLIILVLFWAGQSVLPWSPWRGRYHIIPITLVTPYMAWVYRGRSPEMTALRVGIVAMCVLVAFFSTLRNLRKPIIGDPSIINTTDPAERRFIQGILPHRRDAPQFDQHVPDDACVLLVSDREAIFFLLWGDRLTRTLIPGQIIEGQLRTGQRLTPLREPSPLCTPEYALIRADDAGVLPPDFTHVHDLTDLSIYRREAAP